MNDETLPFDPKRAPAPLTAVKPVSNGRPPGTVLGQYRLVRLIAAGGMGEVYEAIQLNLDRRVALKLVATELATDALFLQRFEREAKAAALLNHPNIVQVYDFGCVNDQYYLAMELVEGKDLAEIVHSQGKIELPLALDIVAQTARALEAALQQHIIHRDIKPSNLLLTRDNVVKVSDLGLAKRLDEVSDMTLVGGGLGSPHFLAPEQASDARTVDHRADIYSLGITLLYLLTGKRPYESASAFSVVLQHVQNPLPTGLELGTELPSSVESVIQRMAAKNPESRYVDYKELLRDLDRLKRGLTPEKAPSSGHKISRGLFWVSAAAAAVVLLAGGAFLLQKKNQAKEENAENTAPKPNAPMRLARDFRQGRPGPGPENGEPPPWEGGPEGQRGPGGEPGGMILPMPRPGPPEWNAIPEGPVTNMLAAANEYARTNKTAYRPIIDRYLQVRDRAVGTEWEGEIQRLLDGAVEAHAAAAEAAIISRRERMQKLLKKNRVQEAYEVWSDFPSALRTREVDRQIRAELSAALPPDFRPMRP